MLMKDGLLCVWTDIRVFCDHGFPGALHTNVVKIPRSPAPALPITSVQVVETSFTKLFVHENGDSGHIAYATKKYRLLL